MKCDRCKRPSYVCVCGWPRMLVLACLVAPMSCAGTQKPTPTQDARIAINAAAEGLKLLDRSADAAYQNCVAVNSGAACAPRYVVLARAETAAYQTLIAAEHGIDAGESAGTCPAAAVNEAAMALSAVVAAAQACGATVPQELTLAIPGVAGLASQFLPCADGGA